MAFPDAGDLLPRPLPHRHRHRAPQGQRQRHRRAAVWAARCAPRCRLLDLLHGDQSRRLHRAADLRVSRTAGELAPRIRLGRHRHGDRRDPIRARRPIPGRGGMRPATAASVGPRGCAAPGADLGSGDRAPRCCSSEAAHTPACLPITATQIADAPDTCSSPCASASSDGCFSAATGRPRNGKRLYVIGVFFLAAALFWSLFEQAGRRSTCSRIATRARPSSAGRIRAAGSSR